MFPSKAWFKSHLLHDAFPKAPGTAALVFASNLEIMNYIVDSFNLVQYLYRGFPGGSEGKASACSAEDPGSIPGSGRSPGEGNDNPLQYSCLENPIDGGVW